MFEWLRVCYVCDLKLVVCVVVLVHCASLCVLCEMSFARCREQLCALMCLVARADTFWVLCVCALHSAARACL